jgi:ribosomal protein S6
LKAYEMMFILSSAHKDDAVAKIEEKIKNELARVNASIKTVDNLGVRTFGRPIKGMESGLYIRMDVEMDPANVAALSGRLKLNEDIARFQIVVAPDMSKVQTVVPVAAE